MEQKMTEWEPVHISMHLRTERFKIFGGWLVRSLYKDSISTVFVPDPAHEWNLAEPSKKTATYLPCI